MLFRCFVVVVVVVVLGAQTSGVMAVSANRREITWNLGTRWKSREVAAPATIHFEALHSSVVTPNGAVPVLCPCCDCAVSRAVTMLCPVL